MVPKIKTWHLFLFTFVVALIVVLQMNDDKNQWQRMNVRDSFDGLISSLKTHHPEHSLPNIFSGLSAQRIAELKKQMPDAPQQLFDFFELYDFQSFHLLSTMEPLSPEQMQPSIESQIAFYQQFNGGFVGWTSSSHDCCKTDQCWRKKWIPIGSFNGDHYFIDMDPSESGVKGQIVLSSEDGKYLSIVGYSLAHWLDRISANIEAGKSEPGFFDFLSTNDLPAPDSH